MTTQLDIIRSDLLAEVHHGFFTRIGGASSGVFEGLNCGFGSSDQSEIVAINRSRVADAMEVPVTHLNTVHQIHSADVVTLSEPLSHPVKADGLVTNQRGIALGALSADCQPVLFADVEAQVIGACHAGWKGAIGGILDATITGMETLGAKRDHIVAVIGPCISQAAYEVGAEFMDAFLDEDPDNARHFAGGTGDRVQFNLPGYGLARLRAAGIKDAAWTGHCTYRDSKRFFSYRRSVHEKCADYGRLISAIRL